jgi:hypothetical protein
VERIKNLISKIKAKLKSVYTFCADNIKHTILAVIISLITFIWGIRTAEKQEIKTNEQIDLLKKQINLSVPPAFESYYEKEPEAICLKNIGIHNITDVFIDFTPFFVFKEGNIMTIQDLHSYIRKNTTIQKAIKEHTNLNIEEDIYNVFKGKEYLQQTDLRNETYKFIERQKIAKLTIETFHPTNFLILNSVLKSKLVLKCNINYKQSETNIKYSFVKYFLIEAGSRQDLENVIGGRKIIKEIDNYYETTSGQIFEE